MRAVSRHVAAGGLALGICNGFQILCEAGLLPGVLMRNAGRRFICTLQRLRVENVETRFTRGYAPGQIVKFAIAHGEGNFEADDETLRAIEGNGQVAFRYCDAEGAVGGTSNPNGSENNIAGVFSDRFNVLGLMPHPENLIDPLIGGVDGRPLFEVLAA
jgi:phosphoribosylformylglycinamidine synthase